MIRDFSKYALQVYSLPSSTEAQRKLRQQKLRKPAPNVSRYQRVWQEVYALRDAYTMND